MGIHATKIVAHSTFVQSATQFHLNVKFLFFNVTPPRLAISQFFFGRVRAQDENNSDLVSARSGKGVVHLQR